jgi:hypothetical protein
MCKDREEDIERDGVEQRRCDRCYNKIWVMYIATTERQSYEQTGQKNDSHPLEERIDMLGSASHVTEDSWDDAHSQTDHGRPDGPRLIGSHCFAMIILAKSRFQANFSLSPA